MRLILASLAVGVALAVLSASRSSVVLARTAHAVREKKVHVTHYTTPTKAHLAKPSKSERKTDLVPVRSLTKTLTSAASTSAKGVGNGIVSDIFGGVKLVASFFKTKYKTESNENYWMELAETASAMAEEAVDQAILRQTEDAVKRMSENLEFYIDNNSTVGDFSALDLNIAMDNERETIMALYAGINRAENIVLQYIDMVTTRLILWQATASMYIKEYSIGGTAPSGDSVCSIVYKWNMTYKTETEDVSQFLLPALERWNEEYKGKLSHPCNTNYVDPTFKQWRYEWDCKVFDGYHGVYKSEYEWKGTCYHKDYPRCPGKSNSAVCNAYCGEDRLTSLRNANDKTYNTIKEHVNTMLKNFEIMRKTQIDGYMKQCGF